MNALVISLALLLLPLAAVQAGAPLLAQATPPSPTPFVSLSAPPVAPFLPSPGKPWFSVVTHDRGSHYEIYATVQNAKPRDVLVEIQGRALKLSIRSPKHSDKPTVKLVSLPDPAEAKIGHVKFEEHAVVITIPKAKK